MANLLWLVGALGLASLLGGVIWLRNRKPRSTEYGIDSFKRELRALAPDQRTSDPEGRRPG